MGNRRFFSRYLVNMKRANEKPTTLAPQVPTMDSAKATGQGQMRGATTTNTVPGTPKGCSAV